MRNDLQGLFWHDAPASRKRGERVLGPMPEIPETGWRPRSPSDLPDYRGAKVISYDVETKDPELEDNGPGWARGVGHVCGFSLASPGYPSVYIPVRHEVQPELNMDPEKMFEYAQAMLGTNCDKVGANLLYDFGWMRQEGVHVGGRQLDVQFAEALINSTSKINLDEILLKYTGEGKDSDLLKMWILDYYGGPKTKWRKDIFRSPITLAGAYGERDATGPLEAIKYQLPILNQRNNLDLFFMECDLIPLLCEMRFAGVSIDIPYCEELRDEFEGQEKDLQKQLDQMVGFGVNVNAGDSLARAFDKLGIDYPRTKPTEKSPNGNPSFVKEFLSHHSHPLPKLVTEIRGLAKLRGTFVEGYLLDSNVKGKVYGSFHPLSGTDGGARTGRFASSTPNLQNIPSRTENGKKIRRAFRPDDGHSHWEKWDYSQIEYRFLAHFAVGDGSDDIRAKYIADPHTDYHSSTAQLIKSQTGIELIRSYVKNINFGLAYGMGIDKLANDLGVSVEKAKELSAAYHKGVPFARKTIEFLSDFANRTGYIETILGRKNFFDLWEPAEWGRKGEPLPYDEAIYEYGPDIQRAYLYRTLNYLLQGSSADQMKSAMLKAYKDGIFDVTGVPRLTVHDELDFSIPNPNVEAARELKRIMQNVIPLRVPVVAELDIGQNWGDVKDLEALEEAGDSWYKDYLNDILKPQEAA